MELEKTIKDWKDFGAVSTPPFVIDLMIALLDRNLNNKKILEPSFGYGQFIRSLLNKFSNVNIDAIEINREIFDKSCNQFKTYPNITFFNKDFLLKQFDIKYDLIIGNPPYGIVSSNNHYAIRVNQETKKQYKRRTETWYGKYNIYGAFIEKSIKLLKENGRLMFIIPATWMILNDFKKLRKFMAKNGQTNIYYLGKNVFNGMNVTTCILFFKKENKGLNLFSTDNLYNFPQMNLNRKDPSWSGEMIRFKTNKTDYFSKFQDNTVKDYFNIKISARSPEVKKIVKKNRIDKKANILPFMKGKNIKKGYVLRVPYTEYYLDESEITNFKSFYSILPRIVVGHTKGGKLVSAIEDELFPYLGDVYHLLPKINFTKSELRTIVDWLNSDKMQEYLYDVYKEITPHITSLQLKDIPIPIKKSQLF